MDKIFTKGKEYIKPFTKVYVTLADNLLQSASGQHTHIGQNGGYGDAKKKQDWEIYDEESEECDYKDRCKY